MKNKPLIDIKLPISCKTTRLASDLFTSIFDIACTPIDWIFSLVDWVISTKYLKYILASPFILIMFIGASVPGILVGLICISMVLAVLLGYGDLTAQEFFKDRPDIFLVGIILGVIAQWLLYGYSSGYIMFSCKKE